MLGGNTWLSVFWHTLHNQDNCQSMTIISLLSVCLDVYVTKHVDTAQNNVSETGVSSRVAVDVLWAVCFGLWHCTPPARTSRGELTSSTDSQLGMCIVGDRTGVQISVGVTRRGLSQAFLHTACLKRSVVASFCLATLYKTSKYGIVVLR